MGRGGGVDRGKPEQVCRWYPAGNAVGPAWSLSCCCPVPALGLEKHREVLVNEVQAFPNPGGFPCQVEGGERA